MFFDGTGYGPKQELPEPPPERSKTQERVLGVMFLVAAFCLLLLPISLSTMVDAIRYFWSN